MSLDGLEKIAAIAESIVTALAVIIGGGWAFRKYIIGREGVWNLRMRLEHEVKPFTNRYDLLLLYLHVENIGKIVIRPGSKGCTVEVREIVRRAERPFMIRPAQDRSPLLTEEIIMSRGTAKYITYEIEPGAGYRHTVPLVLPRGILFEVRAVFWWKNNREATSARAIIDLAHELPAPALTVMQRFVRLLTGH